MANSVEGDWDNANWSLVDFDTEYSNIIKTRGIIARLESLQLEETKLSLRRHNYYGDQVVNDGNWRLERLFQLLMKFQPYTTLGQDLTHHQTTETWTLHQDRIYKDE